MVDQDLWGLPNGENLSQPLKQASSLAKQERIYTNQFVRLSF